MKKKLAQARKPKARHAKPRKAGRTAAAPPLAPETRDPCDPGGDDTHSIEAMLRAQLEATHLAAMDCLRRARTADSPELRDRALTHATRLLSLFTRQVNALERGRPPPPAARPASGAARGADTAGQRLAHATAESPADDPACVAAPLDNGRAAGDGRIPVGYNGAAGGAGSGP